MTEDPNETAELNQSRTRGVLADRYLLKITAQYRALDERLDDMGAEVDQLSGARFRAGLAAREHHDSTQASDGASAHRVDNHDASGPLDA